MRRVIIGAALVLAACGQSLSHGTVVGRSYRAPYEWTSQQCYSYGKNGTCIVQMPVVHQEPAHWYLKLEDCAGREVKKCKHGQTEVSRDEYDRARTGDRYP